MRLYSKRGITIGACLTLLTAGWQHASGGDWSSFQNGGHPVLAEADYATEWSADSGIAWQTPLAGYGQSSPVVAGEIVYVTSVSGDLKDELHVEAFSVKTGKQVWQFDGRNSSPVKSTTYVSKAAPSPACDSDGVIALFEGGNVVALTTEGEVRWQRDLVADYGPIESRHGLSSSLEQNADSVFVWIERSESPYVLALSKKTGETVWKTDGVAATSWCSPRLVPVADTTHLVLSAIGKIVGLDPGSGKRLWTFDGIGGNSTPTPVPLGDGRFLIGATVGRGGSDGPQAAKSNGVIQISGSAADGFTVGYVWQAKGATSSFGTPIAHAGMAWFVNRSGVVYCLDLATGEQKSAGRTASAVWATPIGIGGHIYLFGKNGTTTVIKAEPRFETVAENSLWEVEAASEGGRPSFGGPVLYAATPASSLLLLRRGDRLFAIGR